MPQIKLATESARSRSPTLSAEQLVNCFTERQTEGAKSTVPLFGAPGLEAFAKEQLGVGPLRGGWIFAGQAYFVSADTLYSVSQGGVVTDVGGDVKIPGTRIVSMSDNGTQMIMVNGAQGWIYTLDDGLSLITDDAFYPANTVVFMDGYFVLDRVGTNQYFFSGLYDGATYDGDDFFTAEASPGYAVGVAQNLELLFLFCSGHFEIWYNAGSADLPFQRYSGGVQPYGCISPYTIEKQDGALWFLGVDKVFYRLQGNSPTRVSTHPIETIIEQDADLANAEVTTYTLEGHKFISLTLTGIKRTLVYDISTEKWHERESWDAGDKTLQRWRGRLALELYSAILIGDAFDGTVGRMVWRAPTEYGNTIRMLVRTTYTHNDRLPVFFRRFELDVESGVGLTAGQGETPQVMLRYSKDGARTWSLQQPWRSLGKQGDYTARLRWLSMGRAYQWVWEMIITDPVWRVIMAGSADVEFGDG